MITHATIRAASAAIFLTAFVSPVHAQSNAAAPGIGPDSVTVTPGADYAATGFKRKMLGKDWRDEWTTPIKVPVLHIENFAGGIKPYKEGGGKQGKNLRFYTKDSLEYVFRLVHKTQLVLDEKFRHTIVWSIFEDQGAASHPTSAAAAAPFGTTAGILHANTILVQMPDDPALGEYRAAFANKLGWIEEYPNAPKDAPGFQGAREIIDSEDLLKKLNEDPGTIVDERKFLTARLLDTFMGDNDRHPVQWKWARFAKDKDGPWEPIPRDRDKVFVNYEGSLLNIVRRAQPSLVKFDSAYADPSALFRNAIEQDRRLLGSLDKSVWDSAAKDLQMRLTDAAIDRAVFSMPREYDASSRRIAGILRARRDRLQNVADRYYSELWYAADIHGSDKADRATIDRMADGSVRVALQSGDKAPYFDRRFDPRETRRIRVYLHDGDDTAFVTGSAQTSIPVRVIGGNGTNVFTNSSNVRGKDMLAFYDVGHTTGVKYARDTVAEKKDEDLAINSYFNRRPWLHAYGTLIPPIRDRGASTAPVVGIKTGHGLGLVPRIGIAHYSYGWRKVPYESMWKAELAWATTNRYEVALNADKRYEETDFHTPVEAKATQLLVVQFQGFGNDVPDLRSRFNHVKQTQYWIQPGLGWALNSQSDISLGPIVRYVSTDSIANRFISQAQPYGFPHFGEVGLQLKSHYNSRTYPDTLKPRAVIDLNGSAFPGMWDAKSAYQTIAGAITGFVTLNVPKRPVIVVHGGGQKNYGAFPYFDAAFVGGGSSLRTEDKQRYAGDASLFWSGELRVPVAEFPFILPLDVGLIGFTDAARVYVNGDSPGGWHRASGGGFWVGILNPGTSVNVLFTNSSRRRVVTSIGFAY